MVETVLALKTENQKALISHGQPGCYVLWITCKDKKILILTNEPILKEHIQ